MSFGAFWGDLARMGGRDDDSPDQRRRLALTNQGAVIGVVSCAAFAIGLYLTGSRLRPVALANTIAVVFQVGALLLARSGRRTLARLSILLSTHALVVYATMFVGLAVGFQYYFFLFVTLSYLFFAEQELLLRGAFALLSLGCCVYVCAQAPAETTLEGLTPMALRVFDIVSATAVMSTILLIVQLFTSHTTRAEMRLADEHSRSERLLLNILPASISSRLKDDDHAIADGFAHVTVLFADLVGFTELSHELSPAALVAMLNRVFSAFDDLAEQLGLEKIKTIGDCYLVVAGVPDDRPDHVEAAARMALGIRDALTRVNEETGHVLRMRVGMHTGPVVAGVIGKRKFIYDVWGDTVNVASRMESTGVVGEIQVTREVHDVLVERFDLTPRGMIAVKGRGELETFLLRGARSVRSTRPGRVA